VRGAAACRCEEPPFVGARSFWASVRFPALPEWPLRARYSCEKAAYSSPVRSVSRRIPDWNGACCATGVAGARHYSQLVAWQLADGLRVLIFKFTRRPPFSTDFRQPDCRSGSGTPRDPPELAHVRQIMNAWRFDDIYWICCRMNRARFRRWHGNSERGAAISKTICSMRYAPRARWAIKLKSSRRGARAVTSFSAPTSS